MLILCSSPPQTTLLRPIPAKIRFFQNTLFSLGQVRLSRLEWDSGNAFLNRGSTPGLPTRNPPSRANVIQLRKLLAESTAGPFPAVKPRAALGAAPGVHAQETKEKILQPVTGGTVTRLRGTIPAVHLGCGAVAAGRFEHEPPVVIHCVAAPTRSTARRGR